MLPVSAAVIIPAAVTSASTAVRSQPPAGYMQPVSEADYMAVAVKSQLPTPSHRSLRQRATMLSTPSAKVKAKAPAVPLPSAM